MNIEHLKVGDAVAVCYRGSVRSKATITRVLSKYVETDDGVRWNKRSAEEWGGYRDRFGNVSEHIQPWGPEHDEALARVKLERARNNISGEIDSKRRTLSMAQIDAIRAVLDAPAGESIHVLVGVYPKAG